MPHLFPFAQHRSEEGLRVEEMGDELPHKKPVRRTSLRKALGHLFRRHEWQQQQHQLQQQQEGAGGLPQTPFTQLADLPADLPLRRRSSDLDYALAPARRVIPSLPRPQTFNRQNSEKRERLEEVSCPSIERRAISNDRRRGLSTSAVRRSLSLPPANVLSTSAPSVPTLSALGHVKARADEQTISNTIDDNDDQAKQPDDDDGIFLLDDDDDFDDPHGDLKRGSLQEDYDRCWILNLSMHFRDKSNREKFFVTYAETPNKWRRITISLDYRDAPPGSLEAELSSLHYQRDKSVRIFEAIRESLPDIQYYDTVTNLKLETTAEDGQLHVHVREDANEIVQYPSTSLVQHVRCPMIPETEVEFIGHLSGFVYKVRSGDEVVIKKEIPGPDTVDEFLYEVNALDAILGEDCKHVVQLKGLVTDSEGLVIKGLLISYASKGALVDMLYDYRNTDHLPWHRREKWARQIVQGLSNIHEAGFVQGDFTLSNIVINDADDAQIIDVNRRGCPVGWEPPEFNRLIDSGQRIGMCIGVKTDLFQLGMVLWALAEEVDEPERVERPLPDIVDTVPEYYRKVVSVCLSERPQGRVNAEALLRRFPAAAGQASALPSSDDLRHSDQSISTTHRSDKEYIDPDLAVTIDEVNEQCRKRADTNVANFVAGQVTYVEPDSRDVSTSYRVESTGSWVVPRSRRGRSPVSSRRRRSSPCARPASSVTSVSSVSSAERGPRSERKYILNDSTDFERPSTGYSVTDYAMSDTDGQTIAPRKGTSYESVKQSAEALTEPCVIESHDRMRKQFDMPLHQDSGFDETILGSLSLWREEEGERQANKDSEMFSKDAKEHTVPGAESEYYLTTPESNDPETPGSFATALATPVAAAERVVGDDDTTYHDSQRRH